MTDGDIERGREGERKRGRERGGREREGEREGERGREREGERERAKEGGREREREKGKGERERKGEIERGRERGREGESVCVPVVGKKYCPAEIAISALSPSHPIAVVSIRQLDFLCFKRVSNLHGHSLPQYVTIQNRASTNLHTYSYHTLRARTDACLHSFLSRSIRASNILPQERVLAPITRELQSQLANILRSDQITLATSSMTIGPRPGIQIHTF